MKKRTAFVAMLTFVLALVLVACGGSNSGGGSTASGGAADAEKSEGVMTYAEFAAAAVDDPVTIEAYVQGKQAWWENKASIYAVDADGGYFIYNAECSQADYDKLVPGQKIAVSGFKGEWSGEVEVVEGKITILDGNYVAKAVDVTDKLGSEAELIKFQNQLVAFKGLTVAPSTDPDGKEVAYLYNWDGSGTEGDDLYFNVTDGKDTYSFTVESYLTDANSDVYQAVKNLKVGDVIDAEGFLYWYEGANPHITSITVK